MRKTVSLGCLCFFAVLLCAGPKMFAQTWTFTGSMGTQRAFHSATLLQNGEVLVAGGFDGNGGNIGYLSSAELFH